MNRKGFTLVEILVVIGLIVLMLAVGAVSFGAYLSESSIRLGSRTVSGAFRAARQLAVSQRTPTAVLFFAGADGEPADRVETRRYDAVRDEATGALIFALRTTPEESLELPETLAFKWLPKPTSVQVRSDGGTQTEDMRLVDFFPDGSSRFGGDVEDLTAAAADCPSNHVALADAAAGKAVYLYVYPVTSFIKETYVEAAP